MKLTGLAGAGLLTLGLLSACGEGDAKKVASLTTGAPSATASQNDVQQKKVFTQCLRDHGLKIEDPDPRTGRLNRDSLRDADEAVIRKAMEACRDKMPRSITDRLKNPDAKTLELMRGFAQCMRDQGLDFADPGPGGFDFSKFDRGDPAFAKAAETCQKKHPFAGSGAQ
ncbi:hypothetical protein [Actinomadura macrotermitis]|uniref:Lipoprotein n=1 Tax=Actinomadura macrotermitis TaxID=2585200 RepID=A0A7K0BRK0_9ACTN|nr:hypothetical protein [Actinomadura macrotermitis]MQY03656.1 hypothetical protein [Actinomadura macrotermitis]